MSVLEIKNLSLGYEPGLLIQDLSFQLTGPCFVAILGHNGCGKSTFLNALINNHLYSGSIQVEGRELKSIPIKELSQTITLLGQKNNVQFNIPVEELIVMGKFSKKTFFENYSKEDYQEVASVLEGVNGAKLLKKDFLELSGGEQQIVWLAQAMLQDAKIYLFDEPTQQLDVYNKKIIFDLMQKMVSEKNKTVLCVTHDMHNLFGMKGYILNLSLEQPALERITDEAVKRNIQLLESR